MIEVTIERTGELEELANGKLKEIFQEAIKKTALDTEKECKITVPVDTGNLKRSIHSTIRPDGFDLWGEYYWKYLNAGTSKMSARPFVTNAAKKVVPYFERNIKELGRF